MDVTAAACSRRPVVVVVGCLLVAAGCGGDQPRRTQVATHAGRAAEQGAPEPASGSTPDDGAARADAPVAPPTVDSGLVVDVAGHVRRPGVYRVGSGSRVYEAIAAAGGVRPGADLHGLNRAAVVVDGQHVVVPRAVPAAAGAPTAGTAATGSPIVSLNTADAAALEQLPGIGPVTAADIVADRGANGPFGSVDDLDRVPGIGPTTIEQLRDVVSA